MITVYNGWEEYFPMTPKQCKKAGLEVNFIDNPRLEGIDPKFMDRENKRQRRYKEMDARSQEPTYNNLHKLSEEESKLRTLHRKSNQRYSLIVANGGPQTEDDRTFLEWYIPYMKEIEEQRKQRRKMLYLQRIERRKANNPNYIEEQREAHRIYLRGYYLRKKNEKDRTQSASEL